MVFKNTEDIFFFIKKRCNTFFILPYIWLQINGRFIKDGHGGAEELNILLFMLHIFYETLGGLFSKFRSQE